MTGSAPGIGTEYSESGFREKLQRYGRVAGATVVERALQLYYAAQSPDTPKWAKTVAYGALAYFIIPTDGIPDIVPIAGFTDDLGVIALALGTIATRITPDIKARAHDRMLSLFRRKPRASGIVRARN
jgi:uncharacterized membrane protein YkvA (DUF1232 family)